MATTIALKEETKDILEHAKEELKAETFDEAIRKLVINMKRTRISFFGIGKGKIKGEFVREEIDRFA